MAKDTTKDAGKKAGAQDKKAARKKAPAAGSAANFLETAVRAACRKAAREQGMELNHFLQKAIETYLLDHGNLDDDLKGRITAKRQIIDTAVDKAREIDAKGGFDENFILNVMKAVTTDSATGKVYETAIGGAVNDDKAPRRQSLNQQLGRVIKTAVGAKAKRNEKGKPARAQVAGEAISSYTLLEKTA